MADNISIKDAAAATKAMRTTEGAGQVHTPHNNVDVIKAGASVDIGAKDEVAPDGDTSASGLNGRLQRLALHLTGLLTILGGLRPANNSAGFALSASGINAMAVKTTPGYLKAAAFHNNRAQGVWLKLWNRNQAPTPGSGGHPAPRLRFWVGPNTLWMRDWPAGHYFDSGIAAAVVLSDADNATDGVNAGEIRGLNIEFN